MKIYPAIDIIDGKCVRLSKGDYSSKIIYSDNLEDIANIWIDNGTKFLHIVDLDGAKSGSPSNVKDILEIRKSFPNIFIQIGGGIRTLDTIEMYLSHGINRVILGTKVLKNKAFILSLDKSLRQHIAIDIAIKEASDKFSDKELRLIIRKSGTENCIRIMAEAKKINIVDDKSLHVKEYIENRLKLLL